MFQQTLKHCPPLPPVAISTSADDDRQVKMERNTADRSLRAPTELRTAVPSLRGVRPAKRSTRTFDDLRRENEARGDDYVVEGILRPETVGLVVGHSGKGKSPFAYQMALSVAAGVRFLGQRTTSGDVIVFDFENSNAQIETICVALSKHLSLDAVPDTLRLWMPDPSTVTDPLSVIEQERPILAIIDSLSAWDSGSEEKNSNATITMQKVRDVAKMTGCAIVLVHHLRKLASNPRQRPESLETCDAREWIQSQTRGVSALINASDVRIGVDTCEHDEEAIVVAGYARVDGTLVKMCLRRECDDHGSPRGYSRMAGVDLLSKEDRDMLKRLSASFRFKEAQRITGKGAQPTLNLLRRCISAGVLRQSATRGPYEKVTEQQE